MRCLGRDEESTSLEQRKEKDEKKRCGKDMLQHWTSNVRSHLVDRGLGQAQREVCPAVRSRSDAVVSQKIDASDPGVHRRAVPPTLHRHVSKTGRIGHSRRFAKYGQLFG